ncbi:TPA: hypothetical protein ACGVA0_004511, partial [Vibrio vulnificus]
LVVHCNEQILTYKRDNISSISYPNCWDLPGGGREGNETPEDCRAGSHFVNKYDLIVPNPQQHTHFEPY